MARPRKPTDLKKAMGTFRKDQSLDSEFEPAEMVGEYLPFPDWTLFQLEIFNRIVPELRAKRVVTEADRQAFYGYIEEWGTYMKAKEKLKREGYIIDNGRGVPKRSPWVDIGNAAFNNILRMGNEFGMTPASRTRVSQGVPKDKPGSKLEQLIGKKTA